MEKIYRKEFIPQSNECDCFGRLKPSALLGILQEAAGAQCVELQLASENLMEKGYFWAITRQHVQITRLPRAYEPITVETWPGKTSRVAYPRSTIAYDAQGNELFRSISLWVLMDLTSRALVLPGKSGITLDGLVRGGELPTPSSIGPADLKAAGIRPVRFSELDKNGHMNNSFYMDWVQDLLPSAFHRNHPLADFTVCYMSEAREGDQIHVHYELADDGSLQVNGMMENPDGGSFHRIFAVRARYL